MVSSNSTYQTALKMLTLGYSVIPSGGGDKHKAPLVNWRHYQTTSPDESQLEAWESQLKPRLWGIITNDRIAVIDADTPETRAQLEAELGEPHVVTPRGGAHWYLDTTGHSMKTVAGLLPGVDVRGVGGFANIAGGEYQILRLPVPGDTLIPQGKLPKRILAALNGGKPAQKAKQGTPIPDTTRNATLASLAGTMRRRGMTETEIEAALRTINRERCQPPLDESEVIRIAGSVSQYTPVPTIPLTKPATKQHQDNHHKPELKYLDSVEAQEVQFIWYPYIPRGKLTLLDGDPGVGKSWVMLAVTIAISLGHGLPPTFGPNELGYTLIASAEDGLADTIKPRLALMQAEVSNICAIDGLFTLDDTGFEMLEGWIKQVQPILVIVDPLMAYLSGKMDINKANQVRYATARLARLAEKYNLAMVAIRHLTKGSSLKPLYRGLGSIDFTAAARSVLLAGSDPDNPQTRGIVHLKCNLAPLGEAIGYELKEDGFFWTGHSELTSDRILAASDGGSALEEAKRFLSDILHSGAIPSNDVYEEAEARGVARRTLYRAKKDLGVIVNRLGEQGERGKGKWTWELPRNDDF